MVTGRKVDEEGKSETWDFLFLGPQTSANYLKENHVGWERGEVKPGPTRIGLPWDMKTFPKHSYLFYPISGSWIDSSEAAKVNAGKQSSEKELGAMEMNLQYCKHPSVGIDGVVWEAVWEGGQRGVPILLIDAQSGEVLCSRAPD
jgi:hypothetical protein